MRLRIFHLSALLLLAPLVLLAPATYAATATVTGTVLNGTSGKPAAGVDVILIQLQGGMQAVANTKTDAEGKYVLENPTDRRDATPMPMLVRAVYRGVYFHQPLLPGQNTVDMTVYEPTKDPKAVKLATRVVMFQPNGENLLVVDEYSLQNNSQPPVALYDANGDFEFELPEGAQNSQVSSWGPSKMPVNQGTIDRGKGKFAIAYAFQPGENGVRVTYQLPYPSNKATVKLAAAGGAERVGLVAPASVQIASAGFTPQGQEQGYNFYSRDSVPAGTPFEVAISGTAPLPSSDPETGQPAASGGSVAVQVLPNRLNSFKWMLLGGFAILFSLGVISIWRRPVTAGVAIDAAPVPPAASNSRSKRKKQLAAAVASPPVAAPAPAPPATAPGTNGKEAASAVSAVEREVAQGLDGLKDKLFRLELRRQAGTVSEEDYLRERTQAEKILRELVGR